MKNFFQIEIPKRSQTCHKGQETLSPGMEYYSRLVESASNPFERQDFCLTCWENSVRAETIETLLTYWKSKVPAKKREPLTAHNRDERILALLKDSLTRDSDQDRQESFVLSLYLARRRIIILRQEVTQEDGRVGLLYEVSETEEMLCIPKVALSMLQIDKIQVDIAKKLKEC